MTSLLVSVSRGGSQNSLRHAGGRLQAGWAADAEDTHRRAVPEVSESLVGMACNPALLALASARHVLLLQGPVGPFFDRLTRWLQSGGTAVHRVIFQEGDRHDCRVGEPVVYMGLIEQWPAFLKKTVGDLEIDAIVLFGQTRPRHASAIAMARSLGLCVVVLEEGYFRPGFVTMELDGVNGFSTTFQRFTWVPNKPGPYVQTERVETTANQFRQMAWFACRHYWKLYWGQKNWPNYQHHKSTNIWRHSPYWVRSFLRKKLHLAWDEARVNQLRDKFYFFVPLQHDGDSQITHHSPFRKNTEFIISVMRSFASHAPSAARLVFRQHPHSRGGRGHGHLIDSLATELGLVDRVAHLVEGHTPTIIAHSAGVVLINSTVGLQALMRHKPLKVLGDAVYDRPGLSYQGPLENFWTDRQKPDAAKADAFLKALIGLTQVPCNVYGRADEPLLWSVSEQPVVNT